MPKSLSRCKYARLSAFLTSTFTDPKTPLRLRMQAAMRLADILSTHDANAAAKEIAEARAAARIAEAAQVAPSPPPKAEDEHPDPEAAALAFLLSKGLSDEA